jgi:signal transduction histidine kinase
VTLMAETARRAAEAREMARVVSHQSRLGEIAQQALKEMRLLVYELRPSALEEEGLVGALKHRLDTVERRAGVETNCVVDGEFRLAGAVEEGLYRIAQEALNNALKHADTTVVEVQIRAEGEHVNLMVVDNGRGFDPMQVGHIGGMGLVTMRERAENLGAELEILSADGEGTTVSVTIGTEELRETSL